MDTLSAPPRTKFSLGKKRAKGYGEIETGLLHYITPRMIICLIVPILLITVKFKIVHEYYVAAITLNSIIVPMLIIAIVKAILNNLSIHRAALYLARVNRVVEKEDITTADVQNLLVNLKSEGRLFDTNDMEGNIRNIERYKHPNFSDQNARIIKSKVGQRISEGRKVVSFIGGMLVMLGLIGTYLGLLETVDTVGAVMMKMSSIGGEGEGGGGAEMSSFISDLAEPLQGMALAFSASLFGISGSLFVSIFGSVANHAQNEFIENFSRWVDDRIPRMTAKTAGGPKIDKLPSTDDLKSWLAGFVNLSAHTNRKMSQLLYVLSKSTQAAMKSTRALETILQNQQQTQMMLAGVQRDIGDIRQHSSQVVNAVAPLPGMLQDMELRSQEHHAMLQQDLRGLHQQFGDHTRDTDAFQQGTGHIFSQLSPVLEQLVQTQNALHGKLEQFPQQTGRIENIEAELSAAILQMTSMLEEMNHNNRDAFTEFLSDDDAHGTTDA